MEFFDEIRVSNSDRENIPVYEHSEVAFFGSPDEDTNSLKDDTSIPTDDQHYLDDFGFFGETSPDLVHNPSVTSSHMRRLLITIHPSRYLHHKDRPLLPADKDYCYSYPKHRRRRDVFFKRFSRRGRVNKDAQINGASTADHSTESRLCSSENHTTKETSDICTSHTYSDTISSSLGSFAEQSSNFSNSVEYESEPDAADHREEESSQLFTKNLNMLASESGIDGEGSSDDSESSLYSTQSNPDVLIGKELSRDTSANSKKSRWKSFSRTKDTNPSVSKSDHVERQSHIASLKGSLRRLKRSHSSTAFSKSDSDLVASSHSSSTDHEMPNTDATNMINSPELPINESRTYSELYSVKTQGDRATMVESEGGFRNYVRRLLSPPSKSAGSLG